VSALADSVPKIRHMTDADLDRVMAIETSIYTHPWTRGNFLDSIKAGYSCYVLEVRGELIAYGVLVIAAGEAHVLNISVARPWQRKGYGRSLLLCFMDLSRQADALRMFLEVRQSNAGGRGLYSSMGFRYVAVRPGYYPAMHGREDAILMGLDL
jgi:ribosomal-protein-alanine N-acetyltransferase